MTTAMPIRSPGGRSDLLMPIHITIALLIFIFLGCSLAKPIETISDSGRDASTTGFQRINGQVFIRVWIQVVPTNRSKTPSIPGAASSEIPKYREVWALLDSGSSYNYWEGIDFPGSLAVLWAESGSNVEIRSEMVGKSQGSQPGNGKIPSVTMEFLPGGTVTRSGYPLILGMPFFQSHCIELSKGVPQKIFSNQGKRCPFPRTDSQNIQILSLKGDFRGLGVDAFLAGKMHYFLIDTGSAVSALPDGEWFVNAKSNRKTVITLDGETTKQNLYDFSQSIRVGQSCFSPERVFRAKEIWGEGSDFHPVLGMDFLQTFRIYIDFGSKILGIESDGSQKRKDHCGNERGRG